MPESESNECGMAGVLKNIQTLMEQQAGISAKNKKNLEDVLKLIVEATERLKAVSATATTPEDRWSKLVQIEAEKEARAADREARLQKEQELRIQELRAAKEAKFEKWMKSQEGKDIKEIPADDTTKEQS